MEYSDFYFLDIRWILYSFVTFIFIFHVVIPYSSKRFWIKVDYAWLLLLVFPLLAATSSLQKKVLEYTDLPNASDDFHSALEDLTDEFEMIIDKLKSENPVDSNSLNWYLNNINGIEKFEKEIEIYLTKSAQARGNVYSDRTRDWRNENLCHPIDNIKYHERLRGKYIALRKEKEKIVKLSFEYQNKDFLGGVFHFFISLLYPYFLAAALALRLTKVTEILYGDVIRSEFSNGTWNTIKKFSKLTLKTLRKIWLVIFYHESVRPKE